MKLYGRFSVAELQGDVCVEAECLFIKADIKNVLDRARSKVEKTE